MVAIAHRGVQHRDRRRVGVPAEAQVALVGGDERAPVASPCDDLAEVVDAQYRARRVARGVDEDEPRGPRSQLGQRIGGDDLGSGEPRPDVVGRICQLGDDDEVVTAEVEQRRQPGDDFLGADDRQHGIVVDVGDAVAPLQRGHRGRAQRGGARRGRVSGRRAGRRQRVADDRGYRVDGGPDREVDDAVGVGPGRGRCVGEGVPGEDRQGSRQSRLAVGQSSPCGARSLMAADRCRSGRPSTRHRASPARRRSPRWPWCSRSTDQGRRPRSRWPPPGRPARRHRSPRTRRGGCTACVRPRRCSRRGTPRYMPCPSRRHRVRQWCTSLMSLLSSGLPVGGDLGRTPAKPKQVCVADTCTPVSVCPNFTRHPGRCRAVTDTRRLTYSSPSRLSARVPGFSG